MKTKLLPMLILLLTAYAGFSQQYTRVQDPDILKKMENGLMRQHPHVFNDVSIDSVFTIDGDHSMISYHNGDTQYEAIVNSGREDMMLLETARLVDKSKFPDMIEDSYKKTEYKDWNVKRRYTVERPNGEKLYRMDIQKKGGKEVKSIYFNNTGHMSKSPL